MPQSAASPLIPPDFASLASEACDMWQQHLAACSNDPKAREELMRLLEPSRRMFADWTSMVQNATHGHGSPTASATQPNANPAAATDDGAARQRQSDSANPGDESTPATAGAEAARMAPDDIIVRLAQLAHRMAERMAELEQRISRLESGRAEETGTTPYASEPY